MSEENDSLAINAEMKKMLKTALEDEKETEFIPTGNIGFDLALSNGKGIPVGASVLFWAAPGCGKTTLLGDVSRRLLTAQKALGNNFKILYLAVEGSRELMKNLGLNDFIKSHDFIYVERSLCWRQVEAFFSTVIKGEDPIYKDVKVIVIDSLNNILSDANLSKSVADGDYGTKAKERTMFLSKYLPMCKEKGINVFFIAQERHNQDATGMYAPKKKAAATDGDKHNVDIVLKCSKGESRTDGAKVKVNTIFGQISKSERYVMKMSSIPADCKNRYVGDIESEVLIIPGVGIDNNYVLRCLLEANKFLKASGGWYSFQKELAEAYGLKTGQLRRTDVMEELETHKKELITFLKEAGCYQIVTPKNGIIVQEDNEG